MCMTCNEGTIDNGRRFRERCNFGRDDSDAVAHEGVPEKLEFPPPSGGHSTATENYASAEYRVLVNLPEGLRSLDKNVSNRNFV